jgi:hypothetical protein
MDPTALRDVIRQKITAGALPGEPPLKVWAGMGAGRLCAACEEPIRPHDTQMDVELPGDRSVILHRPCYAVWLEIRDQP